MSDTSRTDALPTRLTVWAADDYSDMRNLARTLERELAAIKAERDALREEMRECHDRIGAMIGQVGHPDYSLRGLVAGMRDIRDKALAAIDAERGKS